MSALGSEEERGKGEGGGSLHAEDDDAPALLQNRGRLREDVAPARVNDGTQKPRSVLLHKCAELRRPVL